MTRAEPEQDPNGEGISGWGDNVPAHLDGTAVSVFLWPDEDTGSGVREPRHLPRDAGPVTAVLDEPQ